MQSVFDLWNQQHLNQLENEQTSVRLRICNAEAIEKVQQKFGANKSQIINDLIGIGLTKLNSTE